jgi:hypothetical protein
VAALADVMANVKIPLPAHRYINSRYVTHMAQPHYEGSCGSQRLPRAESIRSASLLRLVRYSRNAIESIPKGDGNYLSKLGHRFC